jgi:hypothetical protein
MSILNFIFQSFFLEDIELLRNHIWRLAQNSKICSDILRLFWITDFKRRFRVCNKINSSAIHLSFYSVIYVFFNFDFYYISWWRRLSEQIIDRSVLSFWNVTNIKIEKSNSRNSTSNKSIRQVRTQSIQLSNQNTSVDFQNKFAIIQIITNFLQRLQNSSTLSFRDIIFLLRLKSKLTFITNRMSFFIAQLHQDSFSILITRINV